MALFLVTIAIPASYRVLDILDTPEIPQILSIKSQPPVQIISQYSVLSIKSSNKPLEIIIR